MQFVKYNPIVNFIFFLIVILLAMFINHPVILITGLLSALALAARLNGIKKTAKYFSSFICPIIVLFTAINPLFNHYGVTTIAYFSNGNPITLESILYGLTNGLMLGTVMLWFWCYTKVMTSDKFIYLFGKVAPTFSLIFSITLGLIPKLKNKYAEIRDARKAIGLEQGKNTFLAKIKFGLDTISVLISWALENGIETSNSMKNRIYGKTKRTNYSVYTFDTRNKMATLFLVALFAVVMVGVFASSFEAQFNPAIRIAFGKDVVSIMAMVAYMVLCFMPLILELGEKEYGKT